MLGSSWKRHGADGIKTFADYLRRIRDQSLSQRLQDATATYLAHLVDECEEELLWCPTAVYHTLTVYTPQYGKP